MMDCSRVRKFLFAFADGQLSVKDNCEVLDHLKMCPACTEAAENHRSLRRALHGVFASEPLPATLDARIRRSLKAPRSPAEDKNWRVIIPTALAAAACLGLAVKSVWDFTRSPIGQLGVTSRVERGDVAATHVVALHKACCREGAAHQSPELSKNVAMLGAEITRHFGGKIVGRAPDLSRWGYHVASAAFCEIQDDPPGQLTGGHVVYVHERSGGHLSFFSMPHFRAIEYCGARPGSEVWFENKVRQEDGSYLYVVAWSEGPSTYVCCSSIDNDEMEQMVRQARETEPLQ